MMREILFRGKQEYKNKEWVFGSLHSEYGEIDKNGQRKIDYRILGMRGECDYVLSETVGQFTGLTDKNGKKIFEGDILKIARKSDGIGTYYIPPLDYPVNVAVMWDLTGWTWETLCKDKYYIHFPDAWCHFECEVIGNIHDNPELLEVLR